MCQRKFCPIKYTRHCAIIVTQSSGRFFRATRYIYIYIYIYTRILYGAKFPLAHLYIYTCAQKLNASQLDLPHGIKNRKNVMKITIKKTKTWLLRRNGQTTSRWRQCEEMTASLWWERFMKQVAFKPNQTTRATLDVATYTS